MVDRPLDTEGSTANVVIDIVRTLTDKGEAVVIADDIFNELFVLPTAPISDHLTVAVRKPLDKSVRYTDAEEEANSLSGTAGTHPRV